MKTFTPKPLAAALMAALVAAGPSAHAEQAIQENITVTAGRQITPKDETAISSSAVKVLRHIAEARGALQGDKADAEKAKDELAQSEKLLDIIQAALPTTLVKDRIWVAKKHLEYENTDEVLPDLIPVYASLDELVDYVPTIKAKSHLDNAKQALEKGDKTNATAQLKAADDALLYVEADLPLNSTRHLVKQATAQLDKKDTKAADETLAEAEDNVLFVSVSFDSPLVMAKSALYHAWQDFQLGDKVAAKAGLTAAVSYLENAAENGDEVTKRLVSDLVSDVRTISNEIQDDSKNVGPRMENAWHRTKAVSERYAEYISTGWQRFRAEGAGKKDLIEAKLQMAYARIDQFAAKDVAAAKVEVAEAKGYLENAVSKVPAASQNKVKQITEQVAKLQQELNASNLSKTQTDAFAEVESELATLIGQL